MDPNDLLCMAWKWQRGDVSRHTGGDLRAALGRITAKTFVIPMSSDMFFPPADCQAEWRFIPDAEFRPIQTTDGHLALFGTNPNADARRCRTGAEAVRSRRLQRYPDPLHRHIRGLQSKPAWLVGPDRIIPATVAGLVEKRQLGVIVRSPR
jgi:hypothetical protein